jgi:hypothetical protein
MSMEIFSAVCLAVIAIELGVLVAFGVYTLLKIRQAAQAVEITAYRVDHQVISLGDTLRNGWVGTGLKAAMSLAGYFWGGRK